MVTVDGLFQKSFPHMAAVLLGDTIVITFTHNSYNAPRRAAAFLSVLGDIEKAIRKHRRKKRSSFIGIVGLSGTFRIVEEKPLPHRKLCDPRDWESYKRVCEEEGVFAYTPQD